MMTNISHDLRTPLTSAMGYLELIRENEMPEEERKRELMIIQKRLERLEELLSSFFEFSQVISGSFAPELEKISLRAVLEESIAHYFDDYRAVDRNVVLACEASRFWIVSNKNMLLRAFDNLIQNALKHGRGNLYIHVQEAESVVVSFQNQMQEAWDMPLFQNEFMAAS